MLSRNDDRTNTISSSTNAPYQSPGSTRGSTSGTRLFSKCRDSSAKPVSSMKRFARTTHSCSRWVARPANPGPSLKPVNASLYAVITASPVRAIRSVWWWNSATPASVSANRMKSTGMPASSGGLACVAATATGAASAPAAATQAAATRSSGRRVLRVGASGHGRRPAAAGAGRAAGGEAWARGAPVVGGRRAGGATDMKAPHSGPAEGGPVDAGRDFVVVAGGIGPPGPWQSHGRRARPCRVRAAGHPLPECRPA